MEGTSARPQKWALDKDALDAFLVRLDPNRDHAAQYYEQVRSKLLTFFRCNNCWNPEDLVDETIDRVIRRLGEVDVRDLMSFIRGVARRVVSETHKTRIRAVSIEEVPERMRGNTTESEDRNLTEKRHECLEECLEHLAEHDRDLSLEFYRYDKAEKIENKKRIAEQMGITTANLRVRAYRIRKQLEDCITKCTGDSIP
jgi:RNA polymerase sigma factor (sigma-70 family)